MLGCQHMPTNHQPEELCEALQVLKNEHIQLNEQKLDLFEKAGGIMKESSPEKRMEKLTGLRSKVEAFMTALESHSQKEEGHLFELMASYIGRSHGPIVVMEMEHDQAKELISAFLKETELISGNREFVHETCKLIIEAYHVLTSHFMKEEQVLFPMAQNLLSEVEKERLLEAVREVSK
jgi:regulator of cell morphogenesis and NO signaling